MRAENIGIWNKQHFWCGAFDVNSLKVVEVHKYEECEAVDFNSYWVFNKVVDSIKAEKLLEEYKWVFFWVERKGNSVEINTQLECEWSNPTPHDLLMLEGVKSYIRKQINIGLPRVTQKSR